MREAIRDGDQASSVMMISRNQCHPILLGFIGVDLLEQQSARDRIEIRRLERLEEVSCEHHARDQFDLRRRAKERRRPERRLEMDHEAFAAMCEHGAESAASLWLLLPQLAKHGGVERRGVERRAERSVGADDMSISLHTHLMREAIRDGDQTSSVMSAVAISATQSSPT